MSNAPTPGTTGVETAQPIRLRIDWLSFTLPKSYSVETIQTMLGGARTWEPLPRGAYGYAHCVQREGIAIYFGGTSNSGIHVRITGTGCRQLEREGVLRQDLDFIRDLYNAGANFTRIDTAVDDEVGILRMEQIREHVDQHWYVSRVRRDRVTRSRSRSALHRGKCPQDEYCVTLGSPQSEKQLRIYDKAAEQGVVRHWIRVELQHRDGAAKRMVLALIEHGVQAVLGAIRGFVEFKTQGRHSQRERWPTASWWSDFLGECEKLTVRVDPPVQSLERKKAWIQQQVSPTLAFLLLHPDGGLDLIHALLAGGALRLRRKHLEELKAASISSLPHPPPLIAKVNSIPQSRARTQ